MLYYILVYLLPSNDLLGQMFAAMSLNMRPLRYTDVREEEWNLSILGLFHDRRASLTMQQMQQRTCAMRASCTMHLQSRDNSLQKLATASSLSSACTTCISLYQVL